MQNNTYPNQNIGASPNDPNVYSVNYYGVPQQNINYTGQPIYQAQPIIQSQQNNIAYVAQPIIQTEQPMIQTQPFVQPQSSNNYPYATQPMIQGQPIAQQPYEGQPVQGQQIIITLNKDTSQNYTNVQLQQQNLNTNSTPYDANNHWKNSTNNDDQPIFTDKSSNAGQPIQETKDIKSFSPETGISPNWARNTSESCFKNRILNVICCISFLIGILGVLIALMAFHFGGKELKLTSASGALENMSQNLEARPIMAVSLVDRGTSCPMDYEKLAIGRWPGTKTGCKCSSRPVKSGSCGDSDSFCDTIWEIDPFSLYNWQLSEWCVKRAILGDEFVKATVCPSGFRECSPGICIVNTLTTCPITNITLSISNNGNTGKIADSSDGRYLIASSVDGDEPVIGITISFNDLPCFSNDERPKGPQTYPLIDQTVSGCQRYGVDTQFSSMIDSQWQEKLMSNNQASYQIFNLPGYTQVMQATRALLTQRNRIVVSKKEECLSLDTELISKSANAADKMNLTVSVTSILGISLYILFLPLFGYSLLHKSTKYSSWGDFFKTKKGSKVWILIFSILGSIHTIIYIVMFAIVRHYLGVLTQAEDYFIFLDQNGCFTIAQPMLVVKDYPILVDAVASKLYDYSLSLLVISLGTIIPHFLVLFCQRD